MPAPRCKTCRYWDRRYYHQSPSDRGNCINSKVLGHEGDEPDGIYEWEAAEKHSGPLFGCIHHEEMKKE